MKRRTDRNRNRRPNKNVPVANFKVTIILSALISALKDTDKAKIVKMI